MRRLAHISDLHFGKIDPRVTDALNSELSAYAPDLVAVSGDVTQRAKPAQFEQARVFLDGLGLPRLVVPGNHDIAPFYRPLSRLARPFADYRRLISPDLDVSYEDDELLVLGICTADPRRHKEGSISRAQLAWLLRLGHRASDRFGVLITHHPVLHAPASPIERRAWGSRRLQKLLRRVGIRLVLAGHLHESFSGPAAAHIGSDPDVLVVQASTATSTRLRRHRNAYNRITIAPPRLAIEVRAWDGNGFQTEGRSEYDCASGAWRARA
jgi:3',5'-cyclic AMP phosphodiesterase CpdA